MLLTEQQLSQSAAELSDEALLARLRSGDLTELAVAVMQRELAARGISVPESPAAVPQASRNFSASMPRYIDFFLKRVLLFPLNGVRGSEPLWAVIVVGCPMVYLVRKLALLGVADLALTKGVSPHAAPLSYAVLCAYALAALWLGVALWRTVTEPPVLKYVLRFVAVVFFLNCLSGALGAARLVHGYFPSVPADTPSIMDSPRPQ